MKYLAVLILLTFSFSSLAEKAIDSKVNGTYVSDIEVLNNYSTFDKLSDYYKRFTSFFKVLAKNDRAIFTLYNKDLKPQLKVKLDLNKKEKQFIITEDKPYNLFEEVFNYLAIREAYVENTEVTSDTTVQGDLTLKLEVKISKVIPDFISPDFVLTISSRVEVGFDTIKGKKRLKLKSLSKYPTFFHAKIGDLKGVTEFFKIILGWRGEFYDSPVLLGDSYFYSDPEFRWVK